MAATKKMSFLSALHLMGVTALACWHGYWLWGHVTHRLFQRALAVGTRHRGGTPLGSMMSVLTAKVEAINNAIMATLPDVIAGLILIVMFGIATAVYVHKVEIWLHARRSGEAVSLGSARLGDATLEANSDRKGGVR